MLLTVIGSQTFDVVCSFLSPAKCSNKSYNEILTLIKSHFSLTPSEMVRWFHFSQCDQIPDEGILAYVAESHRLSENCNFGISVEYLRGSPAIRTPHKAKHNIGCCSRKSTCLLAGIHFPWKNTEKHRPPP